MAFVRNASLVTSQKNNGLSPIDEEISISSAKYNQLEQRLKHENNHVFAPHNRTQRLLYAEYVQKSQCTRSVFAVNIVWLIYSFFIIGRCVRSLHEGQPIVQIVSIIILLLNVIAYFCNWSLFLILAYKDRDLVAPNSSSFMMRLKSNKMLIQAANQIVTLVILAMYLFAREYDNNCTSTILGAWKNADRCSLDQTEGLMPTDTFIVMMFIPLQAVTIMRETRLWLIGGGWLFIIFIFCVISGISKSPTNAFSTFLYLCISSIVILDILRKNFEKFLTTVKLQETLDENERMAASEMANEMRHMIANVAHDLKTVSLIDTFFSTTKPESL